MTVTLDTLESIDAAQRAHDASLTDATRAALAELERHKISVRVLVLVAEGPGFLGRGGATQISGNTYPMREFLKFQGFRWNANAKAWQKRALVDINAFAPALLREYHAHEDASAARDDWREHRRYEPSRAAQQEMVSRMFRSER